MIKILILVSGQETIPDCFKLGHVECVYFFSAIIKCLYMCDCVKCLYVCLC